MKTISTRQDARRSKIKALVACFALCLCAPGIASAAEVVARGSAPRFDEAAFVVEANSAELPLDIRVAK